MELHGCRNISDFFFILMIGLFQYLLINADTRNHLLPFLDLLDITNPINRSRKTHQSYPVKCIFLLNNNTTTSPNL